MIRKDTLWKGIIEDLAEDFIKYFFTEYVHLINFSRGFTFLDKELKKLSPEGTSDNRHADKLFSAFLKDGQEQWFLIHVEVQGYADPGFGKRMFQYAYRILDRYDRPLTALAIYTDANREYHFPSYETDFMGTKTSYQFRTFILIDSPLEEIRAADNVFAFVIEAARAELHLRKSDDEKRLDIKVKLIRHLFEQGIEREKIKCLFDFIEYYIPFEQKEYFGKFEKQLDIIVKSNQSMGIREAILHEVEGKGREEGSEAKEKEVILRARERGMSVSDIADLLAITVEKVEAVLAEADLEKDKL